MPFPDIRRAEPRDYHAIWTIWMQDHVSKWMSFVKEDEEAFRKRYAELDKTSEIYVMVDLIDGEEKVVGVRRIHFGEGQYQHVAHYHSMGVDKHFQGNGRKYGEIFYLKFDEIIKQRGIKKVELSLGGSNGAAIHLAGKLGFGQEALFPDSLEYQKNDGSYYLYERFIYKFYDDEFSQFSKKLPSLKYNEIVPDLNTTDDAVSINRSATPGEVEQVLFSCCHDHKILFKLNMVPNATTYPHIGYLSFECYADEHTHEAVIGLKKILKAIMQEVRVKKVEIFTRDPNVIEISKAAGFFVRGEKIASICENGVYQNELALEYSFFGIKDARKLVYAVTSDRYRREKIDKALSQCLQCITKLSSQMPCDDLGAGYLENIIYQIIRDEFGPKGVSLSEKKWQPLLTQLPPALFGDINRLYNELLNMYSYDFFTQPVVLIEPSNPAAITNDKLKIFQ